MSMNNKLKDKIQLRRKLKWFESFPQSRSIGKEIKIGTKERNELDLTSNKSINCSAICSH